MAEIRRLLLDPARLIALIMLAVINLALFSGELRSRREEEERYQMQYAEWSISREETEEDPDAHYINEEYPAYLAYVQTQSQTQSVLQKLNKAQSPFVTRNLDKTVQDYQALGKVEVESGDHRALDAVLDCTLTDILLLIAPLLLILSLTAEADTAVGALTRTTKRGRTPLCARRIFAVILFSLADVLLLYGGDFCYAVSQYGSPGLGRAIQSDPAFQLCAVRLTIGEYLIFTVLLKTLAVTVIALLVWLILSRFHPLPGWTLISVIVAGMWLCHQFVMPTSPVNHLRFLNPFAALRADEFFTGYCNLNLFQYPAGFLGSMLIAVGGLFVLLAAGCLVLVGSRYPKKRGAGMVRLFDRISKALSRHMPCHTVFGFEGWKLLFAQRAFVFVCAAIGGAFWLWNDIHISLPLSADTLMMYREFQGEITEKKLEKVTYYIESNQEYAEYLQRKLDEAIAENKDVHEISGLQKSLNEAMETLQFWQAVDTRLSELTDYTARTGLDAWFVPQESYQLLFRGNAMQRHSAMVLLLFLIFAFCGIFAFDNQYGTAALLRATKNGRFRMRLCQWLWIFLLTVFAALMLHGVYILHLAKDVEFALTEAPAQSVAFLQFLPFSVNIRTVLTVYIALRCLAAFALAAAVAGISRFSRNPSHARMISLAAFLLPSALCESGLPLPSFLNFVDALTVTVS
ncbi:MAG: hypothetical protein IK130_07610 [Oscillospiraceae bacterium]|nr:hypothetical protein [Oscillospiraceae bacterium]